MSKREDNQSLEPQILVNILAVTSLIDQQTASVDKYLKSTAAILHEDARVYYLQALCDSLSSSCSMFKYFFDMCIGGSADQMHELMLTPEYIVGITAEALFFAAFALFAEYINRKKGTKKSTEKTDNKLLARLTVPSDLTTNINDNFFDLTYVADAYYYIRDIRKGLKNAYKGWRAVINVATLFHIANASALIWPVGLGLGIAGAANRYWMRSFRDARKKMKENNGKMYLCLKSMKFYTFAEESAQILTPLGGIQQQKEWERYFGYLGSAFGGFVDGLYLYMGSLTLSILAPQLLIAMSIVCTFYTFACIVTRIYEEYSDQAELLRSKTAYELLRKKKIIQALCEQINRLEEKHLTAKHFDNQYETELDKLKIQSFKDELSAALDEFDYLRALLHKQNNTSYSSAFLLGLQNSLFTYSALSSVLFLGATFLTLCSVAMPAFVIVPIVFSGLIFMIGFISHTMLEHHQFKNQRKEQQLDAQYNEGFDELCVKLRANNVPSSSSIEFLLEEQERFKKVLDEKLTLDFAVSEKSKTQSRAEFIRFTFSGISKALKFAEFSGNMLQEQGGDGHYYDTPIIFAFAALLAPLFSLGLAGRSLAKDFGAKSKKPVEAPKREEKKYDIKPIIVTPIDERRPIVAKIGLFARTRSADFTPNNPAIVQGLS